MAHRACVPALCYVADGKRQRKLVGFTAQGAYAYLCEYARYVYVYSGAVDARTQKAPMQVGRVLSCVYRPRSQSDVQVFDVEGEVLGCRLLADRLLVVLTTDHIAVVPLPSDR
jgi:hypothetical protein